MGLEKFMNGDKLETNVQKTALIFDTHNLIFRTLYLICQEKSHAKAW